MNRTLLFVVLFLPLLAMQLSSANISKNPESEECITCHKDIYNNALASPYQHAVAINTCTECHITGSSYDKAQQETGGEDHNAVHLSSYQTEQVLLIEDLEEDQPYEFDITATDRAGKNSRHYRFNTVPGMAEEREGDLPVLTQLSGVTVEEIKKLVFVEATISWMTDVPATSEVEYKQPDQRESRAGAENEFSRSHRVTLNALAHNRQYYYKIISRDMNGNVLESGEDVLDTSDEMRAPKGAEIESPAGPVIEEAGTFRIKGQKGIYVRIRTNKPSLCTVSFKRVLSEETAASGAGENHSSMLAPARYASIDACIGCHDQNASHPVGVKAQNEKVRTPDDLPTIDGGIVTCVSCHFPHGGKQLYFARTDFNRDLCIKCHMGYF